VAVGDVVHTKTDALHVESVDRTADKALRLTGRQLSDGSLRTKSYMTGDLKVVIDRA
jgi:hypothetical protein